jgi:hypothetical protein
MVLDALADVAAAAQAAGAPLQLDTLRVLDDHPRLGGGVGLATAGKLLGTLPNLCCLQLALGIPEDWTGSENSGSEEEGADIMVPEGLGPLKQAAKLRHLYLAGPSTLYYRNHHDIIAAVAELLPLSLERLSWSAPIYSAPADLSDMEQLTFLQLSEWSIEYGVCSSAMLPPGLKELQVCGMFRGRQAQAVPPTVEEQHQVLTRWDTGSLMDVQQQLSPLTNLRHLSLGAEDLQDPASPMVMAQHSNLSVLGMTATSDASPGCVQVALAAAASIKNLKCLHLQLRLFDMAAAAKLAALTGVTRLSVKVVCEEMQQYRALADGVGRMTGLQWLRVPGEALQEGCAWLGSLQQLRVLDVACQHTAEASCDAILMQLLDWCSSQALPPQLRMLWVSGIKAKQAASWRLRHCLLGRLNSSGCELVVGPDLNEVAGPAQQLAGLPAALQQLFV